MTCFSIKDQKKPFPTNILSSHGWICFSEKLVWHCLMLSLFRRVNTLSITLSATCVSLFSCTLLFLGCTFNHDGTCKCFKQTFKCTWIFIEVKTFAYCCLCWLLKYRRNNWLVILLLWKGRIIHFWYCLPGRCTVTTQISCSVMFLGKVVESNVHCPDLRRGSSASLVYNKCS